MRIKALRQGNENKKTQATFSNEKISDIQRDLNLSTRKTLCLAKHIRSASQIPVESHLQQHLYEQDHMVDSFFETRRLLFFKKEKNEIKERSHRWVVLCKNVQSFIDWIFSKRHQENEETLIKIGVDGGGQFLKFVLSVIPLSEDVHKNPAFKYSSVKRLFLLAIVPNVQENYENIHVIWNEMKLNDLSVDFTIATDLKLSNIILGIMAHGSLHPCCWCYSSKNELQTRGPIRTFENLNENFRKW